MIPPYYKLSSYTIYFTGSKIKLKNFSAGAQVTLYKGEEACTGAGVNVSVDEKGRFDVPSNLEAEGYKTHYYYVKQTLNGKSSDCSDLNAYERSLLVEPDLSVASENPSRSATPALKIANLEAGASVALYKGTKDEPCSGTAYSMVLDENKKFEVPAELEASYGVNYYSAQQIVDGAIPPCSKTVEYIRGLLITPSLSLVDDSPGTDLTPTLKVTSLESGATITLHKGSKDDPCSGTGSEVSVDEKGRFKVSSDLKTNYGDNYYSVRQALGEKVSPCSVVVEYVRNLIIPNISLVSGSPGTDATPILKITNLEMGAMITLYKDAACSGTSFYLAIGEGGRFEIPTELEAVYGDNQYSAKQMLSDEENPPCSEAVEYVRNLVSTPSLSLLSESPGVDRTPTLKVANLETDATVTLYKNNSCSGVGSDISLDEKGRVTVPSNLETSQGDNYYSVQQTVGEEVSSCSSSVSYILDIVASEPTLALAEGISSPSNNTTPSFLISDVENGALVSLHTDSSCTSEAVESDTASGNSITLTLKTALSTNRTYTYFAKQEDRAGNFNCSSALEYKLDTSAVAPTIGLAQGISSPSSNTTPSFLISDVENGALVSLHTDSSCTSEAVESDTASSDSITLELQTALIGDRVYPYYAKQVDKANNTSPCSNGIRYTLDTIVATPTLSLVTSSPSNNLTPMFSLGNLEIGGSVGLYSDDSCSTLAQDLIEITEESMNITLSMPLGSDGTYTYSAKQTDRAGNSSNCSSAISYEFIASPFESVWAVGQAGYGDQDRSVTLPLRENDGDGNNFDYDFTVDWGDGSDKQAVTAYSDDITHTYANAGDYTIKIIGAKFPAWYFNNSGDNNKIIEVKNFGVVGWKNLASAFDGCKKLTEFTAGTTDTSQVTDMSDMFSNASSLESLDLTDLNTSSVTDMQRMFSNASSLVSLNISSFDTSSVRNMQRMFFKSSSLTSLNLSNFVTSSVTNMFAMFYYASSLESLDLSGWNTSSVENYAYIFGNTHADLALTCSDGVTTLLGKTCATGN